MCLELKKYSKPKIAKKDIICYKALLKLDDGILRTPYQNSPIKIGEIYQSNIINKNCKIEIGIHSFENIEDILRWVNRCYLSIYLERLLKVKCIIPKGAKYYKGMFLEFNSYASNELKYIEIID